MKEEFKRAWFDGRTYNPELDGKRLRIQMDRVYEAVKGGQWATLGEIALMTGDAEASISARLRDLRKARFGGYVVERRRKGEGREGLFEYRMRERKEGEGIEEGEIKEIEQQEFGF